MIVEAICAGSFMTIYIGELETYSEVPGRLKTLIAFQILILLFCMFHRAYNLHIFVISQFEDTLGTSL